MSELSEELTEQRLSMEKRELEKLHRMERERINMQRKGTKEMDILALEYHA